jgi:hypothetical protein
MPALRKTDRQGFEVVLQEVPQESEGTVSAKKEGGCQVSEITQIQCDAPKCTITKRSVNGWFILRSTPDGSFRVDAMHGTGKRKGDQHICSSTCLHAVLETWIQGKTDVPAVETRPSIEREPHAGEHES